MERKSLKMMLGWVCFHIWTRLPSNTIRCTTPLRALAARLGRLLRVRAGAAMISNPQDVKDCLDRVMALMTERDTINQDIAAVLDEYKPKGVIAKGIRKVAALRRMDPTKRRDDEQLYEDYEDALGTIPEAVAIVAAGGTYEQAAEATDLSRATVARAVAAAKGVSNGPPNDTPHDADGIVTEVPPVSTQTEREEPNAGLSSSTELEVTSYRVSRSDEQETPAEGGEAIEFPNVTPLRKKPGEIPVNLPFERLPQSGDDPGFGPPPQGPRSPAIPTSDSAPPEPVVPTGNEGRAGERGPLEIGLSEVQEEARQEEDAASPLPVPPLGNGVGEVETKGVPPIGSCDFATLPATSRSSPGVDAPCCVSGAADFSVYPASSKQPEEASTTAGIGKDDVETQESDDGRDADEIRGASTDDAPHAGRGAGDEGRAEAGRLRVGRPCEGVQGQASQTREEQAPPVEIDTLDIPLFLRRGRTPTHIAQASQSEAKRTQ